MNSLIKEGAHLNQIDGVRYTPLIHAIERGNNAIGDALMKAGANVNTRNKEGLSALSIAQERDGYEKCIELLQKAEANAKIL